MWTMPEGRNQSCRVPTRIPNLIAKSIFQLSTQYYIYLVFFPPISYQCSRNRAWVSPLCQIYQLQGYFWMVQGLGAEYYIVPHETNIQYFIYFQRLLLHIYTSFPNIILPSCMARLMLRETGSGRTEGRTLHYLLALGQIYIDQCEKKVHFYQYRMSNKQ